MAKRIFDVAVSAMALILVSPLLGVLMFLVWAGDGGSPFYRGTRVGLGGRDFRMLKMRTMTANAEAAGGTSTARSDPRVTPMGQVLRRLKLDELPQFWNVLTGDMSVVGPRPNMRRGGVDHYTAAEQHLLDVRPGITDLASIVFSDEGAILDGSEDADGLYGRIIRPWKSQLGLLYVARRSLLLDVQIIGLTAVSLVSRPAALSGVVRILSTMKADRRLIEVCRRIGPLPPPAPPPTTFAETG